MSTLKGDRIRHLLSPGELSGLRVVQVGVGSGGAPVADHLTMNGVRSWILYDPDVYDELNLVKHPRRRIDLGRHKVDIQREWIIDRNPAAEVQAYSENVRNSSTFADSVLSSDLVLCCVDTREIRSFVNSVAVEFKRPCVTASVFRQGFGGEVYGYVPGKFGCYDCMDRTASEQGWNIDSSIVLTKHEEHAIYGLNLRDFRASGLSMDIQMIAAVQARLALDVLLEGSPRKFQALPSNWIIFYNRPIPGTPLSGFFKPVFLKVKPRVDCVCGSRQ